jgi:hypothetical protein
MRHHYIITQQLMSRGAEWATTRRPVAGDRRECTTTAATEIQQMAAPEPAPLALLIGMRLSDGRGSDPVMADFAHGNEHRRRGLRRVADRS